MLKPKRVRSVYFKSHADFNFLKSNYYKLFLKKTFTNIIITLTDNDNKVIACHSSGSLVLLKLVEEKKLHMLLQLCKKALSLFPFAQSFFC